MTKYELFEQCVSVINDLIADFKSNKEIKQDYATIFYYLFLNDTQNKVKSEILEIVGYKNIAPISNTLEVIWQNNSGLNCDPIRAYRGFSISRENIINNLTYLKTCLEKEIDMNIASIVEEDKNLFIKDLIYASKILQGNVLYYTTDENARNDYIRDLLEFKGYITRDQSRHGRSSKGKGSGEVDLIVCNTCVQDKIIVEGLNLKEDKSKNKEAIEEHYYKLMKKYDTTGNEFNVLLSYVTNDDFPNVVIEYKHIIEDYDFDFKAKEVKIEKFDDAPTISIMKSTHNRNNKEVYIYHILVQLSE